MASSQCSVPATSSTPAVLGAACLAPVRRAPARPLSGGDGAARSGVVGRAPQSTAPATRRDPVRPGARAARMHGPVVGLPVRGGGCIRVAAVHATGSARRASRSSGGPAALRLTRRGRRVVAGLSMAIGLSVAAVTVAVEVASGGGFQLAGSSTVVVQPGDTLWSLAQQLAPRDDPRAVVDAIIDRNDLAGTELMPGQVLDLP